MKALILVLIASFSFAETYKDLKSKAFSNENDMHVRWKSLIKMAETKKKASVPDLKKALKSDTWYMRNAALLALDSINPDLAFEAAKKQLDDPALVVRSAAVDVLAKNKSRAQEVRKYLWDELKDDQNKFKNRSLWIREQIAKILAESPQGSEREKFLAMANEPELRVHAEAALGKIPFQ